MIKKISAVLTAFILTFSTLSVFANDMVDSAAKIGAPDTWAVAEVNEANTLGLISDNIPNYFKLDINRYEFAELMVTCIEKTLKQTIIAADKNTFRDTDEPSVLKAYKIGVVKGIGEGLYDPDREITRQEIAAMMYRAICYMEKEIGKTVINHNGNIDKFTDNNEVSDWAKESVAALAENGIMKGTSNTTLSPSKFTTIQEAVLLDLRIYKLFN